jgi:penicillin-binding protein 1A
VSPKLRKIIKWTVAGVLLLCLIPFTFFLFVYFGAFGKVYSGEELKSLQNYLASDVYSADGKILGSYYWENRSNTDYKHIPGYLVSALIATEDARFYEHNGVDTKGLLRVFFIPFSCATKAPEGEAPLPSSWPKIF